MKHTDEFLDRILRVHGEEPAWRVDVRRAACRNVLDELALHPEGNPVKEDSPTDAVLGWIDQLQEVSQDVEDAPMVDACRLVLDEWEPRCEEQRDLTPLTHLRRGDQTACGAGGVTYGVPYKVTCLECLKRESNRLQDAGDDPDALAAVEAQINHLTGVKA